MGVSYRIHSPLSPILSFSSFTARLGSSSVSTQIARIVVGGMGLEAGPSGPVTRSARASATASREYSDRASGTSRSSAPRDRAMPAEIFARMQARRAFADAIFAGDGGSDDDDSDDDTGFSGFVDSIRRSGGGSRTTFSLSSFPPGVFVRAGPPPGRSYAVNGNDASAGASADNALEIEDSDDDDEVQIVGSRRAPQAGRGGM